MLRAKFTAEDRAILLRRHLDEGIPLTRLAAESGIPIRTIRNWLSKYRSGGKVTSLERQPRSDRGKRGIPQELMAAVEGLALRRPAPTAAFIHRRITDIASARGIPAPSYSTVRALVAGIDPGLRTLAQKGNTAYRDTFELVYRRNASRPNEQWQADHTLLDIEILDPKGRGARPWLTIMLDDYSRAVAGYTVFLGAPSAEQTALALHQAVRRKENRSWPVMGLPDLLYSDHGADFTSARLDRVCLDTHIQLIHSQIGVPQGRGKIERFYGTVTTELLPHLPGYIPHGTRGRPISPPELTLQQLDTILETFILTEYNQRPHSSTSESPVQRWAASAFIPRMPAHPEDLDLLLLTVATGRKVQRDGIQFASTRYVSPVLAAYVGEQVTVRYDPRDIGEIRVYFNEAFLCRAIAPELAAEAISLEQLRGARTDRRRDLKQQLRDRRSLADALPRDTRYVPPEPNTTPAPSEETPAAEPLRRHGLRVYEAD
ncbi:putative transposase [Arthrobacter oryzae]|uniref:Transposase n=1 Tax=Pseudarthrobacter enclensis TaxID=993070 RepID=A0ABT9RXR8_9MICC|nr:MULTISPECIES: Mu transposase C-terminal domain-containing protein [Micrococcaceae]MDP9890038.1 putative transposase [Pseudarthrobacter enclensis]MDP9988855.1 putative transposase [Arthrobacter oryzae]